MAESQWRKDFFPSRRMTETSDGSRARCLLHWFLGDRFAQAFALSFLTVAVFFRLAGYDFVNHDDPEYVCENPHVRTGLSRENAYWAVASLNANISYWPPLT